MNLSVGAFFEKARLKRLGGLFGLLLLHFFDPLLPEAHPGARGPLAFGDQAEHREEVDKHLGRVELAVHAELTKMKRKCKKGKYGAGGVVRKSGRAGHLSLGYKEVLSPPAYSF